MSNKLNHWEDLYQDAVNHRAELDAKITRRYELYNGTNKVRNMKTGAFANKPAYTYKNMTFELIETQVNNSIPMPKVTPRDKEDTNLALMAEGYLKNEADRLDFETLNDAAERESLIQGSVFYMVGWDNTKTTPVSEGELFVKYYPIEDVYPQPGITNIKDAEYIFVKELVSCKKIKDLYNVDIPEGGMYRGMNILKTAYYLNDDGYLSRFGWVDDVVVFDEDYYELRKFKVCKKCGEYFGNNDHCPVCGNKTYVYKSEKYETLSDDIVRIVDPQTQKTELLAKAGTRIPYYKIKKLPFVLRKNISASGKLYGISDVDKLENNQESLNKLMTKMEENVLKGGSIVTLPVGVNMNNTDDTLKIVRIKDPNQMRAFSVQTVQANIQQDDILQERMYQSGRTCLGITDSYQGKRDPTAESGKAKEMAAAQASGRLESKRRMKDAAYADLYELMFDFLLAYCDEPRSYMITKANGSSETGVFDRYSYLDGEPGNVYYNDRFLFDVDSASVLSTSREAMWKETTNSLQAGTFGNPADPQTLLLYWNVMKGLGYPLAGVALSNLSDRTQQLPYEMQQAIMQNPKILQAVQQQLSKGGDTDVSDRTEQPSESK